MRLHTALFWLAFSCSPPGLSLAEENLHEGRWDFDVSYEVVGMDQFFQPYATSRCVSRRDPLPRIGRPGHHCKPSLHGRQGDTVTWVVDCSNDWEIVNGAGQVSYNGDQAKGNVYVQVLDAGASAPQAIVFSIVGHYAGPCESAEAS